jgi:hypothetical protein
MKACKDCKHSSAIRFFGWILSSPLNMKCLHPIVNKEIWNASAQGHLLPDYLCGGPLHRADPVTGRAAYAEVPCSLARGGAHHRRGEQGAAPDFLCLPEGRYWERYE